MWSGEFRYQPFLRWMRHCARKGVSLMPARQSAGAAFLWCLRHGARWWCRGGGECGRGAAPTSVATVAEHVCRRLNTPPLPPAMLNPQVPQGVETLVLRLLAKSPDARPASADEVVTALGALAAAPLTTAAVPGAPSAPPRPLNAALRSPFVAREKELAQLKERLEDAIAGRGFLMMVVGEPGIGKTRLSEELSVYARMRGAQVLLGQCYESDGAPPYIPFVEALRQYVNIRPPEALREEMGDGASDLAKLVSEIRTRVPNLPPAAPQEPEAERYRLLEAVSSFLVNSSKTTPLLLILDDIHWADKPSLVLLRAPGRRGRSPRLRLGGGSALLRDGAGIDGGSRVATTRSGRSSWNGSVTSSTPPAARKSVVSRFSNARLLSTSAWAAAPGSRRCTRDSAAAWSASSGTWTSRRVLRISKLPRRFSSKTHPTAPALPMCTSR